MQEPLPELRHLAPLGAKECQECGMPFARISGRSNAQWESQSYCSSECANAVRARNYNPMHDLDVLHQHGDRVKAGHQKALGYWDRRAEEAEALYRREQRERRRTLKAMLADVDGIKRRLEAPCRCRACLGQRDRLYSQRWRRENPEARRTQARQRRGLNRGADGRSTAQQDAWRLEYYGRRCAYCRRQLGSGWHWDHVIPLARGGTNWPANLRPACATCNESKRDKPLAMWLERGGGEPI